MVIHEHAEACHSAHETLSLLTETRAPVIGTSIVGLTATSRAEREASSGVRHGTERQKALSGFARFVVEVLPFLCGHIDSQRVGLGERLKNKLCTSAICCLLGVSRNCLYTTTNLRPDNATEDELQSIIGSAGVCLRQMRRRGDRQCFPYLQILQSYDCGCDTP